MTNRLKLEIITKYNDVNKVKQIAQELNISISKIQREIDKIYIQAKKLPEVLCIDEFKGDSGKEKYQVSIGDGKNKQIIDILKSRKLEELSKYFSKIPKEELEGIHNRIKSIKRAAFTMKNFHRFRAKILLTLK